MPKKPKRDWITSEEAAEMIGVSSARFRQFLEPTFRKIVFPNSVLVTRTWLHYVKDIQKFIKKRELDPPVHGRVKLPKLPGARRKPKAATSTEAAGDRPGDVSQ